MKKKDLFLNIIEPQFGEILKPLGFSPIVKESAYIADRPWGFDKILMPILSYGNSRVITPRYCRRFKIVENIIDEFCNTLHVGTPFGLTLIITEYSLDLISDGVKFYDIIDYEGQVSQKDIDNLA